MRGAQPRDRIIPSADERRFPVKGGHRNVDHDHYPVDPLASLPSVGMVPSPDGLSPLSCPDGPLASPTDGRLPRWRLPRRRLWRRFRRRRPHHGRRRRQGQEIKMVLHGMLWDWYNVVCRHCVQILRSAQDDRNSIRCHPERKVGNPEGFQVRPVGRTADFQSRGLKTTPCEGSVRFVT